jgi:arginyl-tRNA synthetase
LAKVEHALTSGCGAFLVAGRLSVADIAVVVTLSQQQDVANYSPAIQHYLHAHLSSPIFIEGTENVKNLVPPPPFDIDNDPSMIGAVNSVFHAAISAFVPDIAPTLGQVIEKSKVLKNGDYQCKEAMPLFAQLKASGKLPSGIHSPQQVAQEIVKNIPPDNPVVDSFEVNGPGFILCRVKASYLEHHLNSLMNSAPKDGGDPRLVLPRDVVGKKQTVVVDFSSPNIAKEMHVGHLRSTIIGEAVCRILEFTGANVKRVNHVGDWGTQFGMLITFLKESFPNFGKGDDNVDIGDLTQFYKKAKVSISSLVY